LWIMWENILELERPQMKMWPVCISRWAPNATYAHSEYVILIAFLLQQWLHKRASVLRYSTWPVLLIVKSKRCTKKPLWYKFLNTW
jgi:hypothetical protein